MIVGVDASNLRGGGGVTHLTELLSAARPAEHGIARVVVWGARELLARLPARPWLTPVHEPLLDRPLPFRLAWQASRLGPLAARTCHVLLAPGGNATTRFRPLVAVSQNLLPFEPDELGRYGASATTLRLRLLRYGQARTFRSADGVIFLSHYARERIEARVGLRGKVACVPHGVAERFRARPRPPRPLGDCSRGDPLRLLYVSQIDLYKHPWHVADAVARLRAEGLPVAIDFVGPRHPAAFRRFSDALDRLDASRTFLHYRGPAPYPELHDVYQRADVFVFASSCENMPNTLLEAMAAGLPIACARRGPMPELLGDAGLYFDPERPGEIADALRALCTDPPLRARLAETAYRRAERFSWERCARETLAFVAEVAGLTDAERASPPPRPS